MPGFSLTDPVQDNFFCPWKTGWDSWKMWTHLTSLTMILGRPLTQFPISSWFEVAWPQNQRDSPEVDWDCLSWLLSTGCGERNQVWTNLSQEWHPARLCSRPCSLCHLCQWLTVTFLTVSSLTSSCLLMTQSCMHVVGRRELGICIRCKST